jgi:hypothetical protein
MLDEEKKQDKQHKDKTYKNQPASRQIKIGEIVNGNKIQYGVKNNSN